MSDSTNPLGYRLITGPDDAEFCARVSALLDQGYQLHGSPALTFDGERVIAGQALVLSHSVGSEAPEEAPGRDGGPAAGSTPGEATS
ncbi:DUF1737 domain-containing protein [Micromonospora sp. NPDC007208]|uniref:DUF1737 domain-containing protein n=1 Tax=Micromonospora sp. NPDC007208 TaxID=3364236 RepID=UPI0036A04168